MIILNTVKFAESEKEFTESIFHRKTCSGYAKRLKRQIKLFDHNHNLIGVINKYGVLCCARKTDNNKYIYSLETISLIGKYESYIQSRQEIDNLAISKRYFIGNDTEYYFK
jgi:hypothetical protein